MTRFKFTLGEMRKGIRGDKRNANKFKRSYFDASLKYRPIPMVVVCCCRGLRIVTWSVVVRWRVPSDGARG